MKETVKISLARIAFTIEHDAYQILDNYLNLLKQHYLSTIGHEEIIYDIEERIAELLIESGAKDRVITKGEIEKIIATLGQPNDIDGNDSYDDRYSNNSRETGYKKSSEDFTIPKLSKSIYRDVQNNVLGGVCAGLAAYININVVWIRLIFIFLLLFSSVPVFFGFNISSSFMVLIYFIMWIIIPPAKTVAQRCAMDGKSTSIDDIKRTHNNTQNTNKYQINDSPMLKSIGRVITFCIGVILLIIGISGIVTGSIFFVGIETISGIFPLDIPDYLKLNIGNTIWLKICSLCVYFLPFIGMLYAGTKLCFNFKSPKWRPGLIIFLLWVIAVISTTILSVSSFRPFFNHNEYTINNVIPKKYDTLYIKYSTPLNFNKSKRYFNADENDLSLYYINKIGFKNSEIAAYPSLRIYRQSINETQKLACEVNYFSEFGISNDYNGKWDINNNIIIKDSLITVKPTIYSKKTKFDGEVVSLKLFTPNNTVVILQEPKEHVFASDY